MYPFGLSWTAVIEYGEIVSIITFVWGAKGVKQVDSKSKQPVTTQFGSFASRKISVYPVAIIVVGIPEL